MRKLLGNTSGENTGDEDQASIKTKLGVAASGVDGYLDGDDWIIFNDKQDELTEDILGIADRVSVTGGGNAVAVETIIDIDPDLLPSPEAGDANKYLKATGINASEWAALAGGGDVIAPANNTDDYVPQWDGADSKTLKNGLPVGVAANNLVQLDAAAKLPAVDRSLTLNIPTDSITAHAGGGQADAVALVQETNIITVCATALDSAKLLATFAVGTIIEVLNMGAENANLYPASGDTISGLAADTPVVIPPGMRIRLIGTTANATWKRLGTTSIFPQYAYVSPQLDLAVSGYAGSTNIRSVGIFYKTSNGAWRMKFNIAHTSVAGQNHTFTFTGVVFKNVAGFYQNISFAPSGYSKPVGYAYCSPNASTLAVTVETGTTTNAWRVSGDVELNAKPTGYAIPGDV